MRCFELNILHSQHGFINVPEFTPGLDDNVNIIPRNISTSTWKQCVIIVIPTSITNLIIITQKVCQKPFQILLNRYVQRVILDYKYLCPKHNAKTILNI